MYTLLIAAGAGLLGFVLGAVTVNGWAGIIPGLLAFILAFFLLSRRTMAQVQAVFAKAQGMLQAPPPPEVMALQQRLMRPVSSEAEGRRIQSQMIELQSKQRNEVREVLRSALQFEKWQFLVKENVYAQLGMIDYQEGIEANMMQRPNEAREKFSAARGNLEQAWNPTLSSLLRDWRSRALLAVVLHRETKPAEAAKVMADSESTGSAEPMFWGLWAFILHQGQKADEAMQVVGRGITANPSSESLKKLQAMLTNKQKLDMSVFGDAWYQFFPEDIPQEKRIEMARAAGMEVPDPTAQRPANRPIPKKTYPHPRR